MAGHTGVMGRKGLLLLIRVVVALLLVALVVSRVRLHDRLLFRPGARRPPESGRIVSEKGGRVVFQARDGRTLEIDRRELEGGRPQYGLLGLVRQLRWKPFALAFLCLAGTYLVTIARWRWLCRARGIPLDFGSAFRLSFLGFFFNNAVPGATGGDVMKAYFAARHRGSRTEVFASVILDRIIGLTALVVLAGGALLFRAGDPRFRRMALAVVLLLASIAVATLVYYSRRMRRFLGLNFLGRLLPYKDLVQKVDRAFFFYRFHKGTVILSFLVSFLAHGFTILNHLLIGNALGLRAPVSAFLVYVPIGQVASAIPVFPGGWGVREVAYGYLFSRAGVSFSQATALSILHGVSVLAWSLLGGIFFLAGPERLPDEPIANLIGDRADPGTPGGTAP